MEEEGSIRYFLCSPPLMGQENLLMYQSLKTAGAFPVGLLGHLLVLVSYSAVLELPFRSESLMF